MKLLIDLILALKNILVMIAIGLGMLVVAFLEGKKSVKNKENEKAANDLREENRIKDNVHRLSDSELDSVRAKFLKAKERVNAKH